MARAFKRAARVWPAFTLAGDFPLAIFARFLTVQAA